MNYERVLPMLLAGAVLGFAAHAENIERELSLSPGGRIQIVNPAGRTTVETWEGASVKVIAQLGEKCSGLETTGEGDEAVVAVLVPKGKGGDGIQTDLHVSLPAGTMMAVDSVSADVEVKGKQGEVSVRSASGEVLILAEGGRVSVESVSGDIHVQGSCENVSLRSASGEVVAQLAAPNVLVETISGNIDLTGNQGRFHLATTSGEITHGGIALQAHAESISGDIDFQKVTESADVSSTSADIFLRGENLVELHAQSISGDIRYEGTLSPTSVANVNSKAGEVYLALPADTPARFELRSFSGDISAEDAPDPEKGAGPGSRLSFAHAAATASVAVETFSGDIYIERDGDDAE